jgi:hypothetical protein
MIQSIDVLIIKMTSPIDFVLAEIPLAKSYYVFVLLFWPVL